MRLKRKRYKKADLYVNHGARRAAAFFIVLLLLGGAGFFGYTKLQEKYENVVIQGEAAEKDITALAILLIDEYRGDYRTYWTDYLDRVNLTMQKQSGYASQINLSISDLDGYNVDICIDMVVDGSCAQGTMGVTKTSLFSDDTSEKEYNFYRVVEDGDVFTYVFDERSDGWVGVEGTRFETTTTAFDFSACIQNWSSFNFTDFPKMKGGATTLKDKETVNFLDNRFVGLNATYSSDQINDMINGRTGGDYWLQYIVDNKCSVKVSCTLSNSSDPVEIPEVVYQNATIIHNLESVFAE